jgi:hypothetical protein
MLAVGEPRYGHQQQPHGQQDQQRAELVAGHGGLLVFDTQTRLFLFDNPESWRDSHENAALLVLAVGQPSKPCAGQQRRHDGQQNQQRAEAVSHGI